MQITINGQLLLSMLAEKFVDEIEGLQMLQVNTDGLTIRVPNTKANMDHVMFICEAWEELTGLTLEYAHYQKMIIRDVELFAS